MPDQEQHDRLLFSCGTFERIARFVDRHRCRDIEGAGTAGSKELPPSVEMLRVRFNEKDEWT